VQRIVAHPEGRKALVLMQSGLFWIEFWIELAA
jgi:hypothetical protein